MMRENNNIPAHDTRSPGANVPHLPPARIAWPLAGTAILVFFVMSVFEFSQVFVFLDISPLEWHVITVIMGTTLSAAAAFSILRWRKKVYRQNLEGIIRHLRTEESLQQSEERLGNLIRNINEYVYSVHFHGGVVNSAFHSPQSVKVTGYEPGEYEADPDLWYRMIHPDDRARVLDFFNDVMANQRPEPIEHRVVHRDGSTRWISNTTSALFDEYGKIARLDGFILDITARRTAEDELRRYRDRLEELVRERTAELEEANRNLQKEIAERRLFEEKLVRSELTSRTILDASSDAVFLETLDGRIMDCNQSACALYGYSREEFLAIMVADLVPPEIAAALQDVIAEELRSGGFFVESKNMKKDGSLFPCEVRSRLVTIEGEDLIVVFVHDVTDRVRAEEEIRQLNESLKCSISKLEEANQELEAFNYTVSHDLRLPLLTIGGYANMTLKHCGEDIPEEACRYLQIIGTEVRRMELLLNDLLELSRLESHEFELRPIDMASLTTRIFNELTPDGGEKNAKLSLGGLPRCFGDDIMIEQVLKNLISNALKYAGTRRTVKLEVGGWKSGIENTYFIKDNGVGFDMKDAGRLFTVFERLHPGEDYPGTGVGLTIVQRIVRRHGGRVWANSKPGKGATFYFTLPAVQQG
jgi:PAS domain S-box-containing protein